MNKKKIIIIILVILILFGIYMLYNTFAVSTIASNNESNVYNITIGEGTTITVPKGSSKTIYFHLKNTNNGSVKYAVGYDTSTNIEVKVYEDSKDKVSDIIGYTENKYIKLYLKNPTNNSNTVTITSVLGYENGGDLIVPDGITLITEKYFAPIALSEHITNLYTNASKSPVENNSITYNYAPSVSLMNDRLGGTTSLDGGNIRYYGASPNNYIYFNCSDYNNQSDTTCEKWRIIGVFDGKVKIMRNEQIGSYSWDTSASGVNSGVGENEWPQADLMKLLNPGYENETVGGSLYYNKGSGTCYSEQNNATTSCDFTSSGIKNEETKNKIAEVTWNLGGWNNYNVFSNEIYGYERGTTVYSGRSPTWPGKVALPYPSDYGYATDFNKCSQNLFNYNNSTDSYACRSNDWMYPIITNSGASFGWFLTPTSGIASSAWYVHPSGYVHYHNYDNSNVSRARGVAPTLYLNANEYVESGNGTESNPYHLMKDSPIETASKYITNLYINASKTKAQNNGIDYNYASSESLMNDRLGGTTTSLDGGNIRYYGASPNNYIYFNCETYPDTNCELWRIVGVFDDKVKIIRNEPIGEYSWDILDLSSSEFWGINEWSQAKLMKLLNPGYESESVGGSLYYNSSSGTCYANSYNSVKTKSCDFTSSGIKNDATKNKIAEVTWNLGGWNTSDIYSNQIYGYERGTTVPSNTSDGITRNTIWTGKVAIPYPSDYGYATDFNKCTQKLISYGNASDSYACRSNDWIYPIITNSSSRSGWLLTPTTDGGSGALNVGYEGNVNYNIMDYNNTDSPQRIVPVLYLSSNESIVEGTTGTQDNPYKLNP